MPAGLEPGHSPDGFHLKIALILHQADYSELRKVPGCEDMTDLPQAISGKDKAVEMAKKFGIPSEEIHCLTGTDNM